MIFLSWSLSRRGKWAESHDGMWDCGGGMLKSTPGTLRSKLLVPISGQACVEFKMWVQAQGEAEVDLQTR